MEWSERDSSQMRLTPLCFLNTFLFGGGLFGEIRVTRLVLCEDEPVGATGNI